MKFMKSSKMYLQNSYLNDGYNRDEKHNIWTKCSSIVDSRLLEFYLNNNNSIYL